MRSWLQRSWQGHSKEVTHPMNLAPDGPIMSTRLASASPSIRGGGWGSLLSRTSLQVIRVGWHSRSGGMMMRIPECRHPRIAPPRASTRKLTRNLDHNNNNNNNNNSGTSLSSLSMWVSVWSLTSHSTHHRSFKQRVFPGIWLHCYWQPNNQIIIIIMFIIMFVYLKQWQNAL